MFDNFGIMLLKIPPILLALTVHECAHAYVAMKLGDPTAKMLGRVTLNPIKHLDPIGTLALFLTGMFGWAKPVPVNARNFKDPSKGMMLTAIAGPVSNLLLAVLFTVIYKLTGEWAVYSFGSPVWEPLFFMVRVSIIINIALAVFNMIPIPPLDGSRVLSHLLPPDKAFAYSRIEPYGFMILILLMFTGVIDKIMSPLIFFTINILMSGGI